MTSYYPTLSEKDRKILIDTTNRQWKVFLKKKMNTKDLRFLFISPIFYEEILSIQIKNGSIMGTPNTEHAYFEIVLEDNKYGSKMICGNFDNQATILRHEISPTKLEREFLAEALTEFNMKEFLLKLDGEKEELLDSMGKIIQRLYSQVRVKDLRKIDSSP